MTGTAEAVNLDVRIFAKCVYTLFQHSTNNDNKKKAVERE